MTVADGVSYYDDKARGLSKHYDRVTFEAVHHPVVSFLPKKGSALDVGAGSGRDARALADRGLVVTAAEPSSSFRALAANRDPRIRWVDDRLPRLPRLVDEALRYDFILCSGVLMLVEPRDIPQSFETMRALLAAAGYLWVNVRAPVEGEPTGVFYPHSDANLLAAASGAGLECIEHVESPDALGRDQHRWRSFLFVHHVDGHER
ncbi:class I SAM-dependent methyltransferase [Sphingopyxis panaciterrulae]|uniref:SAM-dependent methyltransferase n=2 Tax=Sphingopyxis TaxID=165697 RepID=A0A7W9B8U5_9SPHN|nr:methyltransferase [Sphingopyxis panaciterrulae]MBB5708368.1 SAM-dependent methyltransferase [Sphingopyxis panaciterrulae]